jgi:hypothetical protein
MSCIQSRRTSELRSRTVIGAYNLTGFYEAGDKPSSDKAPIRLWTTKIPLKSFLVKGPAECLHEFLEDNTQGPETGQTPTQNPSTPTPDRETGRNNDATKDQIVAVDSWGSESPQAQQQLLLPSSTPSAKSYQRSPSEGATSPRRRRYSATGLTRPNVNNQKLTWIHLPFNNPTWCAVSKNSHLIHCLTADSIAGYAQTYRR